jgi:hypothetical protein
MDATAEVMAMLAEGQRRHMRISLLYTDALCADPELTPEQARDVVAQARAILDAPWSPGDTSRGVPGARR